MLSGSGNNPTRGAVLGASTTATGIAALPNTGRLTWFYITAAAIIGIGLVMVAMQVIVAIERRRK